MSNNPGAVILCGGKSSRMGFPKESLMGPGGRNLLETQVARLSAAGFHPIAVGGGAPTLCPTLPHLSDSPDLEGPLAGVASALSWSQAAHVLVLAVDLGAMTEATLTALKEKAVPGRLLVPVGENGYEGTACLWPASFLPHVMAYTADGGRSVHGLLEKLSPLIDVFLISQEHRPSFANWNGPGDLPPGWKLGS